MYPKTFFATNGVKQRNGKCFVIMPFAPAFDAVYKAIEQATEGPDLCFDCSRADSLEGGGHVIEDILREIAEAEVVVADLTGQNPNVFYELGIAQMVKDVDKVILLSQDIGSIPFDLRVFRCITYSRSAAGLKALKPKLVASVKSVAKKSFRFTIVDQGTYVFAERVMGPDGLAYDFEIPQCFLAVDGAKFMLRISQYAAGRPPKVAFDQGRGLDVGERLGLPGLEWELLLEKVENKVATFVLSQSS